MTPPHTAAMASQKPQESQDDDRTLSPLFPEPNEKGEYLYAKQIHKIVLYRQLPGSGRNLKMVRVSKRDYRMPDGGEFEFNPYETTEDDIEEQFGGGSYYIRAVGFNNEFLPCQHPVYLSGPTLKERRQQEREDGGDDDDGAEMSSGYGYPPQDPRPAGGALLPGAVTMVPQGQDAVQELLKAQQEMVKLMQASADKRADDAKDFAMSSRRDGPERDALVTSLREELEDLRKQHRSELERRAQDADDERRRFRKQLETLDDEYAAKRRAYEAELERERSERRTSVEHERDRYRKDLDDERKRRLDEVEEARRRADERVERTTRDAADLKLKLEKRIDELQKEVFELRGELADVPSPEEGPKSKAGVPDDAPWWVKQAAPWVGPIAKGVAETIGAANARAAPQPSPAPMAPSVPLPSPPPAVVHGEPPPPPPPPVTGVYVPPPAPPMAAPPPSSRPRFRTGPSITVSTTLPDEDDEEEDEDENLNASTA